LIWGYHFRDVEEHLATLGYRRIRETELTLIFMNSDRVFTIRKPNVHGSWPEPTVLDAFDVAGLEPPPPASRFVD
jgi:hypothetical protein